MRSCVLLMDLYLQARLKGHGHEDKQILFYQTLFFSVQSNSGLCKDFIFEIIKI